jgi:hypothetical protein
VEDGELRMMGSQRCARWLDERPKGNCVAFVMLQETRMFVTRTFFTVVSFVRRV